MRLGVVRQSLAFSVLLIFSLSFVSAYFTSARTFTQDIVDTYVGIFEPFLQVLFGGYGWSGLYLFERFLLFILLLSIVFLVLGKIDIFKKNTFVRWIVAIIVPLLGIRFIDYEWLTSVLLAYQVAALALTTAVPLLVFVVFIHYACKDYPHVRKVFWLLFIGVYVGLWSTAVATSASTAYFWTFVAAILLLIFDKKIEYRLHLAERRAADRYWHYGIVSQLKQDIRLLRESGLPDEEIEKAVKRKEKEIKRILDEHH